MNNFLRPCRVLLSRCCEFFGRERRDRDLAAEIQSHLELHIEELVARGTAPAEARRQALIALGGVEQTMEAYRDRRGWPQLESVPQDFRFSLRILRKHAKLTCIAVLSLAVGMAAASAGISVLSALRLRAPAVPDPGRVLAVYSIRRGHMAGMSYRNYVYFRDNSRAFSGLAVLSSITAAVTASIDGHDKDALTSGVSSNYFATLGVTPILGPGFPVSDDVEPSMTAVLSYSYWKSLGSDPNIIGKSLILSRGTGLFSTATTMSDVALTVVGVAPEKFSGTTFALAPDFWYPVSARPQIFSGTDPLTSPAFPVSVAGRLASGVTRPQALADAQRLARELASIYPESDKNVTAGVAPLTLLPPEEESSRALTLFSMLVAFVVALVLFAACANVTNLLLALAEARREEILVRAALGATRARLVRQLLLDSAIISAAGGLIGFALASYGFARLTEIHPVVPLLGSLPLTLDFTPDFRVLAAVIALIFAVGIGMGLVPGLHASTPHLATALNGEVATGAKRKTLGRNLLVIAQVAVCTLISVGVGICLKSLLNLEHADTGYTARNVVIFGTNDLVQRRVSEQQGRALYERIREDITRLPGIQSFSLGAAAPLNFVNGYVDPWDVKDRVEPGMPVGYEIVDGRYFSTVGVPLLAGRVFTAADAPNSERVVVINRTMADRYWPNQSPIGRSFRIDNGKQTVTVVGIVGNSAHYAPDDRAMPNMYFPLSQRYSPSLHLVVQTKGDPKALFKTLSSGLQTAAPNIAFTQFTLADRIRLSELLPRLVLFLASAFGALAWALAAAGLYGAVFYSVGVRTREMGIRIAFGAQSSELWKIVLREVAVVSGVGICVGLGGGSATTIVLRSLLHGVKPVEWSVLVGVSAGIIAMALAISYLAARPWVRTDPVETLRHS